VLGNRARVANVMKRNDADRTDTAGLIPLLVRRGGCATKKMLRSHRSGADGVVARGIHTVVSDHPAFAF
jgi:hypothetical protein